MESRPLVDGELPDDGKDDVMANVPLPRRRVTEVKFRFKDMYLTLQNIRRKKSVVFAHVYGSLSLPAATWLGKYCHSNGISNRDFDDKETHIVRKHCQMSQNAN